jgi:hypothetical protein
MVVVVGGMVVVGVVGGGVVGGGVVGGGVVGDGVVGGGMVGEGMIVIRGVFVCFEILARFPRVRVRSAEVCFDYIFTVNSITNRLINMYSIGV